MEGFEQVVQYLNVALFGALAVICVRHWVQRRDPPARWAAVGFGILGGISLLGLVLPDDSQGDAWQLLTKVLLAVLVAYPYALFRFAATFHAVPRGVRLAIDALVLATVVASLALPRIPGEGDAWPWWFGAYVALFLGVWGALGAIPGWWLWRAGDGLPTVTRRRMRMMAAGATGLAAVLFFGLFGDSPVASVASAALTSLAAVAFYIGFAPPAWLRTVWRRPEQAELRRLELAVISAPTAEDVAREVLPRVAGLLGGGAAMLVEQRGGVEVVLARHGEPAAGSEVRVDMAGGRTLVLEASPYAPFFGAEELALLEGHAGLVELVLERLELLERERRAREAMQRMNAELETLVYGISHDLRSPLVSVLGYLEYLREDYGDRLDGDGTRYVERIEASARYMEALIGDLLELSRIGRAQTEEEVVELDAVVAEIAANLAVTHPGVRVEAGALPAIWMNPLRVRQLLTNLLENAARHGGRADLTVRITAAERLDGGLDIVVADDGVGIPPEYREKVFGIFERLDPPGRSGHGTGIGLAVCRRIVEHAGGTIEVVDADRGAAFRMILPRSAVPSGPPSPRIGAST